MMIKPSVGEKKREKQVMNDNNKVTNDDLGSNMVFKSDQKQKKSNKNDLDEEVSTFLGYPQ